MFYTIINNGIIYITEMEASTLDNGFILNSHKQFWVKQMIDNRCNNQTSQKFNPSHKGVNKQGDNDFKYFDNF